MSSLSPTARVVLSLCLGRLVSPLTHPSWRHLLRRQSSFLSESRRPSASSMTALVPGILRDVVNKGDTVIDATCGNGYDSFTLAALALEPDRGFLICYDIQTAAIAATKSRLSSLRCVTEQNVDLRCENHKDLGRDLEEGSVKAIVYNLGYLPGGDKGIITRTEETLQSLNNALSLITRGGLISVMCYQGHEGGREELKMVEAWSRGLDCELFIVQRHELWNRPLAPILFTIYRNELSKKEPPRRKE